MIYRGLRRGKHTVAEKDDFGKDDLRKSGQVLPKPLKYQIKHINHG